MTEQFVEPWTQHLRLAILRSLLDLPDRSAHESLIVDLVNAVRIGADRDQVRGAITWLHEQGLVVAEVVKGSLAAQLTERGERVAEGKSSYPGVKRPSNVLPTAAKLALDNLKG